MCFYLDVYIFNLCGVLSVLCGGWIYNLLVYCLFDKLFVDVGLFV